MLDYLSASEDEALRRQRKSLKRRGSVSSEIESSSSSDSSSSSESESDSGEEDDETSSGKQKRSKCFWLSEVCILILRCASLQYVNMVLIKGTFHLDVDIYLLDQA